MVDQTEPLANALRSRVATFCVGPVCAAGFTDAGFDPPHVPERHRLGAMVQQISVHFARSGRDYTLAGRAVRIQGNIALIDDRSVTLSDREQALLDVLLERPGVVFSKAELLQRVWHDGENDQHLVEVTVARLRRRLGPDGDRQRVGDDQSGLGVRSGWTARIRDQHAHRATQRAGRPRVGAAL